MSQFSKILQLAGGRPIATPKPQNEAERREDEHLIEMLAMSQKELSEADIRAHPAAQGAEEREPLLLIREPFIMRLYRLDDVMSGEPGQVFARLYAMSKPVNDEALGLFQMAAGSEWGESFFLQRMLVR